MESTIDRIDHLIALWRQERRATQARFAEERRHSSLSRRVERGLALTGLSIEDMDAALGGRTLLWLSAAAGMRDLRVGPGAPVRLWWDDPDSDEAVLATVTRRRRGTLGVMVDGEVPARLYEGEFKLDRDDPGATFARGLAALRRFRGAKAQEPLGRLRQVLFGGAAPDFDREETIEAFDGDLNDPQRAAVARAMAALDVALIHGPPGTGKTRTLVEVIRQAVSRGDRVLATAASNAAVDNLAVRLVASGLAVVRMGHPARVSPEMEARTLDALMEATDAHKLARKWMTEAAAVRRKAINRYHRGSIDRRERRDAFQQARRLENDARKQLRGAKKRILARQEVICATAAGADAVLLEGESFDLVVLDEATQAPDPIALVAASRAPRLIMAGDPRQLPPTIIDRDAERQGLGRTFFERLEADDRGDAVRMLTVQHRMHEAIMAFPSMSMYEGRLTAAPAVAEHLLDDLGVALDPLRPGPLLFLDTGGKGWDELRDEDNPSTSNPGQAERVAAEVRRLLERGVSPADLAIITPYSAQVRSLRGLLTDACLAGLEIGTVDGFQGREKEAVVLDLVRSNERGDLGFLKDTRRMNVALTRARRWLLVVGDSATLGGNPYYAAFMEAVEVYGAWISAWDPV